MKPSLLIALLFTSFISFGQVSLSSLMSAPIGNSYEQDVALRKKIIRQKYVLRYWKDENKYSLEFENVPVDNYGNAEVVFNYLRNSLANVEIYFRSDCSAYASLVQLYKELDLIIKQKYKGVINVRHGFEYELLDKNVYDSAEKIFNKFQEKKLAKDSTNFIAWDDYKLGQSIFKDNRSVSLTISLGGVSEWRKNYSQVMPDTICQEYLNLYIYNARSLELEPSTTTGSRSGIVLERRENVIDLKRQDGVYLLKIKLNAILDNQEFVFDTGASDVTITPDVFLVCCV